MNERQKAQINFLQSGHNIVVGEEANLPLSLDELCSEACFSKYIVTKYSQGLTAEIFHLKIADAEFCLKRKREKALVHNIDGETSFLNEVQRRFDFQKFKSDPQFSRLFENIVSTIYANYRRGIILSPWICGEPLKELSENSLRQILSTVVACENVGLMEWDLCPGNMIDDQGKIWLFDFGYMYSFNPLTEFNSNGTSDPLFHGCERFETRFFFRWVLQHPEDEVQVMYRVLKKIALEIYLEKYSYLRDKGASLEVLNWLQGIISSWEEGLSSSEALKKLFLNEAFRSHVLDIEDDLHGRSCTRSTLKRIEIVLTLLKENYLLFKEKNLLFYGNRDKTLDELRELYQNKYQQALKYQIRI